MLLTIITFSAIIDWASQSNLILSKAKKDEIPRFICTSGTDEETRSEEKSLPGISLRSFLLKRNHHWNGGIIPYEIGKNFTQFQQLQLLRAMNYFALLSCVRWEPRRSERDYIMIRRPKKKNVCNSPIGRRGGVQFLTLGDDCFNVTAGYLGAIEHEMMHSMGFIHEQQRIDRDCYVLVTSKAINKFPHDYAVTLDTSIEFPYDFKSIMHYGTQEAQLGSLRGEPLGNLDGKLTELDVMKLKNIYCYGPTYCERHRSECSRLKRASEKCWIGTSLPGSKPSHYRKKLY